MPSKVCEQLSINMRKLAVAEDFRVITVAWKLELRLHHRHDCISR
uniref:Uncharacterized protein n=1 Tax=Arundo donax TaxID=35708 RepID=A0A0A9BSR3_ARUDO